MPSEPTHRAYAIGDVILAADRPLPGLCAVDAAGQAAAITLHAGPVPPAIEAGRELYRDDPDDATLLITRSDDTYFVEFAQGLRTSVTPGPMCRIVYDVRAVVDARSVDHLLVDQLLPRTIGMVADAVVLHASGVVIGGRASLFAGASGAGKTSLALGLAHRGAAYIADDAIVLRVGPDDVADRRAACLRRGVRRFDSSADTPDGKRFVEVLPDVATSAGHAPVAHLYLIDAADADTPAVEAVGASEALVALLATTFRLALDDAGVLAREMALLSEPTWLASVKRLHMPRGDAGLARTLAFLEDRTKRRARGVHRG